MDIRLYPLALAMALSAGTAILVTGCNREQAASPNASVQTQGAATTTTTLARATEGVKDVNNDTTPKGDKLSAGENAGDGIVTAKVKAALVAEASVKGVEISVATSNGAVQLSGFLDDQAQIDRAIDVTRGVEGVSDVVSKLSVRQ